MIKFPLVANSTEENHPNLLLHHKVPTALVQGVVLLEAGSGSVGELEKCQFLSSSCGRSGLEPALQCISNVW